MIYKRVKAIADERGLTIAKIERGSKVANGTIARWKRSIPKISTLSKVAKYLEVPIEEILKE